MKWNMGWKPGWTISGIFSGKDRRVGLGGERRFSTGGKYKGEYDGGGGGALERGRLYTSFNKSSTL